MSRVVAEAIASAMEHATRKKELALARYCSTRFSGAVLSVFSGPSSFIYFFCDWNELLRAT